MDLSISLEKANELSVIVHKNAVDKLLYNGIQNDLAHILSEVSEAWVSKDVFVHWIAMNVYKEFQGRKWKASEFRKVLKGSLGEELADIAIGIISVAKNENIDLGFYWGKFEYGNLNDDISITSILNMISDRISKLSKNGFIKNSISWRAFTEALCCVEVIAARCDIDLLYFVEEKIKYNETRPVKHVDEI